MACLNTAKIHVLFLTFLIIEMNIEFTLLNFVISQRLKILSEGIYDIQVLLNVFICFFQGLGDCLVGFRSKSHLQTFTPLSILLDLKS